MSIQTIERTSLSQLVSNEEYARKVLPHMKGDYFSDKTERTIFDLNKARDKAHILVGLVVANLNIDVGKFKSEFGDH